MPKDQKGKLRSRSREVGPLALSQSPLAEATSCPALDLFYQTVPWQVKAADATLAL